VRREAVSGSVEEAVNDFDGVELYDGVKRETEKGRDDDSEKMMLGEAVVETLFVGETETDDDRRCDSVAEFEGVVDVVGDLDSPTEALNVCEFLVAVADSEAECG